MIVILTSLPSKPYHEAMRPPINNFTMAWKTIKSEIVLKNTFFTIKKDKCKKTDGKIVESYYTIIRPDVVAITALTKDKKLIVINQYRHQFKRSDLEIPAGYAEAHEKNIKKSAERELLEETGFTADLKEIQTAYTSSGLMNNKAHFFIGLNAKKIAQQKLDENEEIGKVLLVPWKKALTLIKKGKIKDMTSVCAILIMADYLRIC